MHGIIGSLVLFKSPAGVQYKNVKPPLGSLNTLKNGRDVPSVGYIALNEKWFSSQSNQLICDCLRLGPLAAKVNGDIHSQLTQLPRHACSNTA